MLITWTWSFPVLVTLISLCKWINWHSGFKSPFLNASLKRWFFFVGWQSQEVFGETVFQCGGWPNHHSIQDFSWYWLWKSHIRVTSSISRTPAQLARDSQYWETESTTPWEAPESGWNGQDGWPGQYVEENSTPPFSWARAKVLQILYPCAKFKFWS